MFPLPPCTGNEKNQWKRFFFLYFLKNLQFMHRFWYHCLIFIIKSETIDENSWDLWHWLLLVTLFLFLTKKNIDKSFFAWELSYRTAVIFFVVRSVNNNINTNNSNNNMAANPIITSIKSPTPSTATLRPTTTNHANHLQLFDEAGWNEHVSEPQPCRYSSKEQACCLRKLLIKFGSSFVLILFNEILQNFSPRLFAAFVPLGKYLLNFSNRGLMFRVHVLCLIDCDDVKSIENCLYINPRFFLHNCSKHQTMRLD